MTGSLLGFRVDSSPTIGSGHLARCLALASQLRDSGVRCVFVCRAHVGNLNSDVINADFELCELPGPPPPPPPQPPSGSYSDWLGVSWEQDASETLEILKPLGQIFALVVDHYALDARWERLIKQIGCRLLAIDDLADRQHDVDILFDVTPDYSASRYSALLNLEALRLLGPRYALLRPEFMDLRTRLQDKDGRVRRILISFGATDTDDWTGSSLDVIRERLGWNVPVDVIIGRGAVHRQNLERRANNDDNLVVHVDTPDMALLMFRADIAIGAGGTSSWERACVGLPALASAIAPNQRETVETLADAGCVVALSADLLIYPKELASALSFARSQPGVLRLMSQAALRIVDGLGTVRVAKALLSSEIKIRRANWSDCKDVWEWRNDEYVRRFSQNPASIAWVDHKHWFDRALHDESTDLLICYDDQSPLAVLRFNISERNATISIFLAPHARGRGLGAAALREGERWLRCARPEIEQISAVILPANTRSIAAFGSANYEPSLIKFKRDLRADAP